MSGISAFMPWYVGDYLRDTAHLEAHEHGAYLLLLAHAWQHDGAIPLDHERIRKIAKLNPEQWVASESTLLEFWQKNGIAYRNNRVDVELRRAKASYEQKVNAGKSRAYQRTLSERSAGEQRALSESQSQSHKSLKAKSTTLSGKPDDAIEILDYLNSVAGSRFKPVKQNTELIAARLKQGATVADCKAVIDAKHAEWSSNPDMAKYLRPSTLFNATKFAQYQGAAKPAALGYNPRVLAKLRQQYGQQVRPSDNGYFYDPALQVRFNPVGDKLLAI